MARQYPNIDHHRKENHKAQAGQGKPCIRCHTPTTGKVEIQVSYMRGDDEHEPICNLCWKTQPAEELLQLILASWSTAE